MSEKRFTYCLFDGFEDNGKELSPNEVLELLNNFNDENEQLKKESYGNLDGLNYYQEQNGYLSEKISNLECEIEQLKRQIGNLEHTKDFCADVCADCERLEKENEQLKMGINSLKLLIQNWEALDEEKDGQLDKQNQALKKLKKENKQLKSELLNIEEDRDYYKSKAGSLEEGYLQLQDREIRLKKENEELRKENNELKKENYGNLDGLNYYLEQNGHLSSKISDLECEIEQLKQQIDDFKTYDKEEFTEAEHINNIYKEKGFCGVIEYAKDKLQDYGVVTEVEKGLWELVTGGWSDNEHWIECLNNPISMFSMKHYRGYLRGGAFYYTEKSQGDVKIILENGDVE